jgi:hypothetical protein
MIGRVPAACFQHAVQLGFQLSRGDAQAALRDLARSITVAELQAPLQQILYGSWEGQRRRRSDVRDFPAAVSWL